MNKTIRDHQCILVYSFFYNRCGQNEWGNYANYQLRAGF